MFRKIEILNFSTISLIVHICISISEKRQFQIDSGIFFYGKFDERKANSKKLYFFHPKHLNPVPGFLLKHLNQFSFISLVFFVKIYQRNFFGNPNSSELYHADFPYNGILKMKSRYQISTLQKLQKREVFFQVEKTPEFVKIIAYPIFNFFSL